MRNISQKVVVILGPTASGKTALAVLLARQVNGEIISADSRQIFKNMDLGTGKDIQEYQEIPYHLIDILDAGDDYSAADFQSMSLLALKEITAKTKIPIICGGTTYYVKSLIEDYKFGSLPSNIKKTTQLEKKNREELYKDLRERGLEQQRNWKNDSKRRIARALEKSEIREINYRVPDFLVKYNPKIYVINIERDLLRNKIKDRLENRFNQGMIDEVQNLLKRGINRERLERYGLEYKWISLYLHDEIKFEVMNKRLFTEICRFAKRQKTFLRYLQKQGHEITQITDKAKFLEETTIWLNK